MDQKPMYCPLNTAVNALLFFCFQALPGGWASCTATTAHANSTTYHTRPQQQNQQQIQQEQQQQQVTAVV
jgi:hypothetical protein